MNRDKSQLFLQAYESKEHQRKNALWSKFMFLCSELLLEPVHSSSSWRAYILEDIYIEMLADESLWLIDLKYRTWQPQSVYPAWIRDCSECCHHIPGTTSHTRIGLSWDLITILEQVGEYLYNAPRAIPAPDETYFRWIAKRHNEHLSLEERLFGPEHKYYDLCPGLIRGLFYKLFGKSK